MLWQTNLFNEFMSLNSLSEIKCFQRADYEDVTWSDQFLNFIRFAILQQNFFLHPTQKELMDLATIFHCEPSKLNWILCSDLFHSFLFIFACRGST